MGIKGSTEQSLPNFQYQTSLQNGAQIIDGQQGERNRSIDNKIENIQHIYIKIKENVNKKDIEKIVQSKKYLQLLNNETWYFSQWDMQADFAWFLGIVDTAIGVKTIKAICKGHQCGIIKQIQQIRLPNLQKLCLQSCSLESVQFLPYLNCPNLKQLYLNDNNLTSIKPLRRLKCNLSILSVTLNHIPNLQENLPWMISFNNQQIDLLSFQAITRYNQQNGHFIYGESVDWIFKIPTKTIIRIEAQALKRIPISLQKFKIMKHKYLGKNGIFFWGPNHKNIRF